METERFRGRSRSGVIENGARMLGVEVNELISDVIMGMREVASEIGLGEGQGDDSA